MILGRKVIGRDRRRTASVIDQSAYFDGRSRVLAQPEMEKRRSPLV